MFKKNLVNKVGISPNEIAGFEKKNGKLGKFFVKEGKVRLLVEHVRNERISSLKASQPSNPEMGFILPFSHAITADEYTDKVDKLRFRLLATHDRKKLDSIENEIEGLLNQARAQLNLALYKQVDLRSSQAHEIQSRMEYVSEDRKSVRKSYNKTLGEIEDKKDREEAFEQLMQHVFDKLKQSKSFGQVGDEALKGAIRKNLALMRLWELREYLKLGGENKELFDSFVMKDAENPNRKEKEDSMGCC